MPSWSKSFRALAGLFVWIPFTWAVPNLLWAFTGDITKDPSELVRKYLSLDKRGARLEAQSVSVTAPYVAWEEEPVWGRVVVIRGYEVITDPTQWQIVNSMEVFIPVTFDVVGTMHWGTATFSLEPSTELIYFHIKALQNQWKIIAPQLPPHVGQKRLRDYVRHAWLQESESSRKRVLKVLEEQLRQAR